ncbi:hypothetical protein ACWD42_28175, partial [Streptomyces sp. NPDC002550]
MRTQLAAAGLPVEAERMDAAVSGGVEVTVDPGADEAGGVYVGRHPAPVLTSAGTRRPCCGRPRCGPRTGRTPRTRRPPQEPLLQRLL